MKQAKHSRAIERNDVRTKDFKWSKLKSIVKFVVFSYYHPFYLQRKNLSSFPNRNICSSTYLPLLVNVVVEWHLTFQFHGQLNCELRYGSRGFWLTRVSIRNIFTFFAPIRFFYCFLLRLCDPSKELNSQ